MSPQHETALGDILVVVLLVYGRLWKEILAASNFLITLLHFYQLIKLEYQCLSVSVVYSAVHASGEIYVDWRARVFIFNAIFSCCIGAYLLVMFHSYW